MCTIVWTVWMSQRSGHSKRNRQGITWDMRWRETWDDTQLSPSLMLYPHIMTLQTEKQHLRRWTRLPHGYLIRSSQTHLSPHPSKWSSFSGISFLPPKNKYPKRIRVCSSSFARVSIVHEQERRKGKQKRPNGMMMKMNSESWLDTRDRMYGSFTQVLGLSHSFSLSDLGVALHDLPLIDNCTSISFILSPVHISP